MKLRRNHVRVLFDRFHMRDIAFKVVGVGSVGTISAQRSLSLCPALGLLPKPVSCQPGMGSEIVAQPSRAREARSRLFQKLIECFDTLTFQDSAQLCVGSISGRKIFAVLVS